MAGDGGRKNQPARKWFEGKFERLITKTNPDRRSGMGLASILLFLTDFGQKLDE